MKKPTIASNTGGIPELIHDNKTGLLVENGNSDMIVERISKLLNEPDFAKRLGENGHNFVRQEFSWEIIAEKFIQIINRKQKSDEMYG